MLKSYMLKFVCIFIFTTMPYLSYSYAKLMIQIWNQTPYNVLVTMNNSISGLTDPTTKNQYLDAFNKKTLPANPNLTSKSYLYNHTGEIYGNCQVDFTLNVVVTDKDHTNYGASDRFRFEDCNGLSWFKSYIIKPYNKNGIQFSQPLLDTSANVYKIFIQNTTSSTPKPPPPKASVISIGLGEVSFNNGVGQTISYDKLDKTNGHYLINFSQSTAQCDMNKGFITCPADIAYDEISSQLIFLCQQKDNQSAACPWAMKKNITKNLAVNYYN